MNTVFPPLPKNLTSKRPALTVNTIAGTLRQTGKADHASDMDNIQQYLDALNRDIASITTLLGQAAVIIPPAATTLDIDLLAGNTTAISPPAPSIAGELLFIRIKSEGPTALILWSGLVKWAGTEFDSTINTYTLWPFVSLSDPSDGLLKWFLTVPTPITGQS